MKIFQLLIIGLLFFNLVSAPDAKAACSPSLPTWSNSYCTQTYWGSTGWGRDYYAYPAPEYVAPTCQYVTSGYTCTKFSSFSCIAGWTGYRCTKDNYSASQNNAYTLTGSNIPLTATPYNVQTSWDQPSPFIYLHNAPNGPVSVSLSSVLDSYSPKPLFNQERGWNLESQNNAVTLDGAKIDHLFYELALKKIDMTRNGRNFASKDEVIAYLNDSDFLTKLGFTEEEKQNSLGYIIPKIREASDTEYYYLTVLESKSIADISTLTVTPKPKRIDRQYFAVYPTKVPVRTDGDFVFPKTEKKEGFTVKETGEFLINSDMFVFFK